MSKPIDIIIIGAGMVGSSAAIALAQKGFQVALIERSSVPEFDCDQTHDLRVSALSAQTQHFLSRLGVWALMESHRLCPYREMHVWDENSNGELHFNSADSAQAQLGHIVENKLTQYALFKQLENNPNIYSFWDYSIEHLEQNEHSVSIQLSNGKQLTGKLLIAADGRQSKVRALLNTHIISRPYQQKAIVANVTTEKSHKYTAWQRFLSTGPLAFLPLSSESNQGHLSSIVWSCENNTADTLMQMPDKDFCSALSTAFEHKLGNIISSSQRAAFPLSWQYAEDFVVQRCVFIGDAAHGIHPLAGLGVNLGFADVQILAELLNIGSLEKPQKVLRRYERQRKHDSLSTLFSMSAINETFLNTAPLLTQLRGWGMNLIDQQQSIKRYMMSVASSQ